MEKEKIAEDVVELFRRQEQQIGDVCLRSIKVSLPVGCEVEEVVQYIVDHYPQYKAHAKENRGGKPMLAIGHR